MLAGKQSVTVHYPVSRDESLAVVRGVERPADHPCRASAAQVPGNGAVGCDPAVRYQFRDLIDTAEESVILTLRG